MSAISPPLMNDVTDLQPWPTLRPAQVTHPAQQDLPIVSVCGAPLCAISEADCIQYVLDELDHGRGGSIITMNLDHLRRFVHEPSYAAYCWRARLLIADGMPLVWASRLQGAPLPERITGSNLIWSLSQAAAGRGKSIFLLGGRPGTDRATAKILQTHYPDLSIVGTFCPPVGFENDTEQVAQVAATIAAGRPDIIYVALGSPKQEILIDQLRDCMPRSWWLGVGIAFSFVAGEAPRAPLWMQRAGLEWAHRLAHEPRRLAKRYLVQGIPFALSLFWTALTQRFNSSD